MPYTFSVPFRGQDSVSCHWVLETETNVGHGVEMYAKCIQLLLLLLKGTHHFWKVHTHIFWKVHTTPGDWIYPEFYCRVKTIKKSRASWEVLGTGLNNVVSARTILISLASEKGRSSCVLIWSSLGILKIWPECLYTGQGSPVCHRPTTLYCLRPGWAHLFYDLHEPCGHLEGTDSIQTFYSKDNKTDTEDLGVWLNEVHAATAVVGFYSEK